MIIPLNVARSVGDMDNTNTVDVRPLRVTLANDLGVPLAGVDYAFSGEGLDETGVTDEQGIAQAVVPRDIRKVELEFWPDPDDPDASVVWELSIGELEPVSTTGGMQARLDALGFHCGEQTGSMNDETKRAIRAFQDFAGLPVTGEADGKTLKELERIHGGAI
jgi:hypothetical protein